MWNMLWPMLVIVTSNTIYNVCAKSTPSDVNPFFSLAITYTVATLCSVVMFLLTAKEKGVPAEFAKTNWASWVLGVAIVGLEFGFLMAFRNGWLVSQAQLVASIAVACALICVGVLLFKETLTVRQVIGMAICAVGLVLIAG